MIPFFSALRRGALTLLSVVTAIGAQAQTLRPQVALVNPAGGQRGSAVTVTLNGVNLGYGTRLLTEVPGLTVESFAPEAPPANAKNPDGKVVVRLKIAPDAPLGRFPFRVLTPFGPSDTGYFVIGEWPEVEEKEPNNNREAAQKVTIPATINGRVEPAEDQDFYRVTLQQGETCVFAAAAGSIGSALTPVLTLQDAAGRERAAAAALNRPDAVLTFTAPEAGDYFLSLRDLRYQGGPNFFYRLTMGGIPAVVSVFPLGGAAGATVRVALKGVNLPAPPERLVTLPPDALAAPLPLPEISEQRLDVGTFPEAMETEPNDLPETAQRLTVPVTVNGRLYRTDTKPDMDCFRFLATKGQAFTLEVLAARLGSPLDGVLSVLDGTGRELASNDDARGKDPALTFVAPETKDYIVRVRDLNDRSGPDFGYRLRIAPVTPDFSLWFTPDCLSVAPGDRVEFRIVAERRNGFDGDIALSVKGLPAGVRFSEPLKIPRGQTAVSLLAIAAPDAAPSVSPLHIAGSGVLAGQTVVRVAQSRERSLVRRDDRIEEATRPVPFPVVAIIPSADVRVYYAADRLRLTAGKTADWKILIDRRPGFTAKVPIIVQNLPANVTVTGAEIPESQNETTLLFKAEPNAAPGEFTLRLYARSLVDELRFTDHAASPVTLILEK